MKILLVEDDLPTGTLLKNTLMAHQYAVELVTDGETGLKLAQAFEYDLILLDLVIPKLDGITLCRQLRSQGYQMPILLLTAQDASTDRVIGLDAGADDYMVKPFNLQELMARVRALLRRGKAITSNYLTWAELSLDSSTSEVKYAGKLLRLTPKEYGILELFLLNPKRIFSRNVILDRLWDAADAPNEETVTTHIKDLRQKLVAAGASKDFIETVYGLGYRFKSIADAENSGASVLAPAPSLNDPVVSKNAPPFDAVMAGLWEQFRGTFTEQVQVLEQVATALAHNTLTPDLQQQAKLEAHKLTGSLGTFGHPNGSALAQQLEALLQLPELHPVQADQIAQLVQSLQQDLGQKVGQKAGQKVGQDSGQNLAQVTAQRAPHPLFQEQSRLVLVIDDDRALTDLLATEAVAWNIQVAVASTPALAHAMLAHTLPDAILLDLTFSDSSEDGLAFLRHLAPQNSTIPVVVFTGRGSLGDRIEVARLGGRAFLQKPVPSEQIFQTLAQVMDRHQPNEGSVLVVDDDPAILAALRSLLEPWGLQVTTLADPQQFWQVLEECTPDLVLLDVEMPTFSGIELCQAMRNDPYWSDRPVLFLTAHTDGELLHHAFAAGADDYICKPIVAPQLVTRIMGRIDRARRQREKRN